MTTSGDLPSPLPETPAPETSAAPLPLAETAPVVEAAAEPVVESPVAEVAPVAEEVPAPVKRAKTPKVPKPAKALVSDDTLAEWQASLAAAEDAKQRAARAAQVVRNRAEGFRQLRAALSRLEEEKPEVRLTVPRDIIRDDRLALAVHEAPEHIRTVIAATLRMLKTAPRRGRR